MFRDALTLWQLEWKRCKWLWIGVIILMAAGQAMLKLPQGNMPGFLKWCPLGLAFLSPLFFSGAIASILMRNRLPVLLTLPVKSRRIYWIYYFGALILCFLFASTLCLTQVFSFVDLLLGVSLLFLIHSVVFWSALLRRDGSAFALGFLLLFPLYAAWEPLILFLNAFFLSLPPNYEWQNHGLPSFLGFGKTVSDDMVKYFLSLPLAALTLGIIFLFAGATLWNRGISRGRNIGRSLIRFLLILFLAPSLLTLGGYAVLTGTEWILHRYWAKRIPVQEKSSYPEFYNIRSGEFYRGIKGTNRAEVIPEKVLEFSRRIIRDGQKAKRFPRPASRTVRKGMVFQEEPRIFLFGPLTGINDFQLEIFSNTLIFSQSFSDFVKRKQWNAAEEILRGSWNYLDNIQPQCLEWKKGKQDLLIEELYRIIFAPTETDALPLLRTFLKELEQLSLKPPYVSGVDLPPYHGFFALLQSKIMPHSPDGRTQQVNMGMIQECVKERFCYLYFYSALAEGNREIRKAAECRTEKELSCLVKTLRNPDARSYALAMRNFYVANYYRLKVLGIAQLKYWIAALEGKKAPELPAFLTIRNGIVYDEITGFHFGERGYQCNNL